MLKGNYIHQIIGLFFILYINFFSQAFALSFKNAQSVILSNDDFLFVHETGVDICDKDLTSIKRTELVFESEDEIIYENLMRIVLLKKSDDGYIICLIRGKIYIFDELGHFLHKSEDIPYLYATYYTLSVKDNYHFFIGYSKGERAFTYSYSLLYLYYYEYNKSENKTSILAESGGVGFKYTTLTGTYNYIIEEKGINCDIMYNGNKEERLACFLTLYDESKYYFYIDFFYLSDNLIKKTEVDYIKSQIYDNNLDFFKVEVNSDKTKALICGAKGGWSFCFNYDTSPDNYFNMDFQFTREAFCLNQYYSFKINYFEANDEFVFSCLGYDKDKAIYTFLNLDSNTNKYIINNEKEYILSNANEIKKQDEYAFCF